jgi:hypothetical protein
MAASKPTIHSVSTLVSTTFRTEYGDCGGEQFQTLTPATRTERRLVDQFFGWVARFTAALNPYIPR